MLLLPYAPDEAADVMTDEVAWLQGAFISSLLCGVQITLSTMSFLAVLRQRLRQRLRIFLLVYIFVLCAIMTTGEQANLQFMQTGFIEQRNYPGGPNEFLSHRITTPVFIASTCLFIFGNWMMESLLVWRCKVVCCTGDRPVWLGVIIPFVFLLGEYASGILFLNQLLRGHFPIRYAIAYSGLSLLLNVAVTAIIAGRLLLHRRRMVREFGQGHGGGYATAAAILIESASLYTCFLILVIVFFTVGTAASNALQQLVAQVETITSLMIIYRIAKGKDWKFEPSVSEQDWRGDTEAQVEQVQVVHLQNMANPQATQTDSVGHAPSILSKDDEAPISVVATLSGAV